MFTLHYRNLILLITSILFACSVSALTIRDSLDFQNQSASGGSTGSYEADALPLSNLNHPQWANFSSTTTVIGSESIANGILTIDTSASTPPAGPTGGPHATKSYANIVSGVNEWWSNEASLETGFTAEIRLKISSVNEGFDYASSLLVWVGGHRVDIRIGANAILWAQGGPNRPVFAHDMQSDFQRIRVAYNPESESYWLWYNNTLIRDDLTGSSTTGGTRLVFGDPSQDLSGIAEIDYVRWDTTGAYAPIPEASATVTFLGLAGLLTIIVLHHRRRRVSLSLALKE